MDPNRLVADPTGLVQKLLAQDLMPNTYIIGDGLNTAGYQWLAPGFSNRDQETCKIDHYFTPNNHINVVFTHEVDKFTNTTAGFPAQPADANTTVTSYFGSLGFTSTIRANLLNELRMGMQHPDNNSLGSERAPGRASYIPPATGGNLRRASLPAPLVPFRGNNDFEHVNPLYTVADTLSWVKGRHSFRWGAEVDYNNSTPITSSTATCRR